MVCETFGCPPDVAERQEWAVVQAIQDYRAAMLARDLFNSGRKGFEQLRKRPELQRILLEMYRVQSGNNVTLEHVFAVMGERGDESEDG